MIAIIIIKFLELNLEAFSNAIFCILWYNNNDILVDFKYVYEVKLKNESHNKAYNHILDYVNANKNLGYSKGKYSFPKKKVNFLGERIKIEVEYEGDGVIKYSFWNEYSYNFLWSNVKVKKEIKEEKLKNALVVATWVGIAVAGAIIVATIVEDVVTYGAGVADDAYSVGVAASSYSTAVSSVVRFAFGF